MKVYRTDEIRNVVLLGHGGSGKTSLVEAMAYVSGAYEPYGKSLRQQIRSAILIKKNRNADFQSVQPLFRLNGKRQRLMYWILRDILTL